LKLNPFDLLKLAGHPVPEGYEDVFKNLKGAVETINESLEKLQEIAVPMVCSIQLSEEERGAIIKVAKIFRDVM
jgi:hypothetical protein